MRGDLTGVRPAGVFMPTVRQKIAEALKQETLSLRDLSQMLGIKEKEVLDHLDHVARSYSRAFEIDPASCRRCGFVFGKRNRLSTPGRCPECKAEQIVPPRFHLRSD